ncbi:MAG: hypothetical protein ABSG68_21930 [Thermoguttaceae bacterium]|jgi:hypothetical protein
MFSVMSPAKWQCLSAEKWTRPRLCSSPAAAAGAMAFFARAMYNRVRTLWLILGRLLELEQLRRMSTAANKVVAIGFVGPAIAGYILCLVLAGSNNRYLPNPDAVAYIRIATYYSKWQTDLMVSGHWGPLISWLMAPLLPWVSNPFYAARIVMGISAILFTLAGYGVLRQSQLPAMFIALATLLIALASIVWSVEQISPDLLVGAFMCFGCIFLLDPNWRACRKIQARAGLLFGIAHLAKAVALPTFCVLAALVAAWSVRKSPHSRRAVFAVLLCSMAAFAIFATPWILILSLKYGRPVFSTSGSINHAAIEPSKFYLGSMKP